MQIGVFLARFQPPHKSHEYIISKMLQEMDKAYVFIGSSDKSRTTRNPLTIQERTELLTEIYKSDIESGKLIILPLSDYSSEDDFGNVKMWGEMLYDHIICTIHEDYFHMYYSDDSNIILDWFTEKIKNHITFHFLDRDEIFDNLSATKIREALLNNDIEYLKENLNDIVYQKKDKLTAIIRESK